MFELIIFEIIGLLESSSRYFHWRLELTLLLFMVIALIPFYIAYSSISNICFGMIIFVNNILNENQSGSIKKGIACNSRNVFKT